MQKRKKLAYVVTPITFGGAEKVNLNFLMHVDRKAFDVHVIALLRPWEKMPFFMREVQRLGVSFETLPVAVRSGGRDPLRILRVAWRLYRSLKSGRFDLVHTHGYFADICGLPVARLLRIPSFATCHGFIDTDRKLQLYNRLDRYMLRLCHHIIAVSEDIRQALIAKGVSSKSVKVLTNAVAESQADGAKRSQLRAEIGLEESAFVFGFIGRLSPEKGVSFLLEAVAELRTASIAATLVVVGEGSERESLEQQAQTLGIADECQFVGFQEDVNGWLSVFDCFVLPSLTEGTPMALLEAMAIGVPVVASKVGGIPKIIESGHSGMLVPAQDRAALADALAEVHRSRELQQRLSENARQIVRQNYSAEVWCRTLEGYYSEAIACQMPVAVQRF